MNSEDPLKEAFADLVDPEGGVRERNFPVPSKNYIQRKKDAMKAKDRSAARKLIKPKNADQIIELLPEPGDLVHAITCGDFVMGDCLGRFCDLRGCPSRLTISTLSLSVKNAEMFSRILEKNPSLEFELLLSHYFQSTNGDVFTAVERLISEKFPDRARVGVNRSHAKIFLFDYKDDRRNWVIESSANLRSSNNMEQMTISNDRGLLDFHREWICEMLKNG